MTDIGPDTPRRRPEPDWSPAGVIDRAAETLFPWLIGEPDAPCLRISKEPEAGQ
jgi:hypothetical protein